MNGLPDGTRLSVSGGASAEEVAAVVMALDQALARPDPGPGRRPGWREAARREAVGGALVRSPADLETPLS